MGSSSLCCDITDNVLSIKEPEKQWSSFGWNVIIIDGHDIVQILKALEESKKNKYLPTMIIAHTRKGHGISIWDNTAKSHGSWGPSDQDYSKGKKELEINRQKISATNFKDSEIKFLEPMIKLKSDREENSIVRPESGNFPNYEFKLGEKISLRNAFGMAAANLAKTYKNFDLFDADVKSGTMAVSFEKHFPNR